MRTHTYFLHLSHVHIFHHRVDTVCIYKWLLAKTFLYATALSFEQPEVRKCSYLWCRLGRGNISYKRINCPGLAGHSCSIYTGEHPPRFKLPAGWTSDSVHPGPKKGQDKKLRCSVTYLRDLNFHGSWPIRSKEALLNPDPLLHIDNHPYFSSYSYQNF